MPPVCPICMQAFSIGHAPGCSNGPQRAPEVISFSAGEINARSAARTVAPRWNPLGVEETAGIDRAAFAFIDPLVSRAQEILDWRIDPPIIATNGTETPAPWDGRPVTMRVGLPSAQGRQINAQGATGRHTITAYTRTAGGSFPAFTCTCGWEVTCGWVEGLAEMDIRAMLSAHEAGGKVGPTQAKFAFPIPFKVACFNCCWMPEKKVNAIQRRILEACCDGEVRIMPRRRIVLGEEEA